jgi:hypothetical protein
VKKTKFKFDLSLMGKKVIVTKIMGRMYEGFKRTWYSDDFTPEEKRVGWIVGYSWVCDGIYNSGTPSYFGGDCELPCLKVTEKKPCLLVSYWPNQKPVKIPLDGFVEWDGNNIEHCLLVPYCSSGYGSGVNRQIWLQQQRNWANETDKRDSKGRFIR